MAIQVTHQIGSHLAPIAPQLDQLAVQAMAGGLP